MTDRKVIDLQLHPKTDIHSVRIFMAEIINTELSPITSPDYI